MDIVVQNEEMSFDTIKYQIEHEYTFDHFLVGTLVAVIEELNDAKKILNAKIDTLTAAAQTKTIGETANIQSLIIPKLLNLISKYNNDGVLREEILAAISTSSNSTSIYKIYTLGERDKNTPFCAGSLITHIVKDDYTDGKFIHSSIIYEGS